MEGLFDPTEGSDERQFNSPGFNLPIGNISRTIYEKYLNIIILVMIKILWIFLKLINLFKN